MAQGVWPKLWVNPKSTRETELAETYPIHVVTAWLGNSPQVTDEQYETAVRDFGEGDRSERLQNVTQLMHETPGDVSHVENGDNAERLDLPEVSVSPSIQWLTKWSLLDSKLARFPRRKQGFPKPRLQNVMQLMHESPKLIPVCGW